MDESLKMVFKRFDDWVQFPGYSLERRIDIYISFFLKEILSDSFEIDDEKIIPEFPIPTLKNNNLSSHIDFLCISKNAVVLVEFKTDPNSVYDEAQVKNYRKILSEKWEFLDLHRKKVWEKTAKKYREKYAFLDKRLGKVPSDSEINFVYLVPWKNPKLNDFVQIDFEEIIEKFDKVNDERAELANNLKRIFKEILKKKNEV
jgi:hypothetical protein